MTTQTTDPTILPARLRHLEEEFATLESRIDDSPVKDAISLLHGMLHEVWRQGPERGRNGGTVDLQTVMNLWRSAPAMEGEAENEPIPVGTPAPDFELPDASGRRVRLSDFRGRPVVLVFYPLDWSPGCSQQLDLYQSEMSEFERRDAALLGISVDSVYSHGAWAAVRGLEFPLLSDFHPHGAVTRRYGVFRASDGFSERALYVVDPQGIIRYAHVSPYLHHVPDVDELFKALDGAQETEATHAGATGGGR